MKLFITGATGFIGRPTIAYLLGNGYEITAWVRNLEKARDMLGYGVKLLSTDISDEDLLKELDSCDGVLNLSGESLAGVRWNRKKKKEIIDSRVGITKRLVNQINLAKDPPKVLVSASAIGYYGDRGSSKLNEESPPGRDFLSTLCMDWESAALNVNEMKTRICLLRIGIVLGREGGILAKTTPSFEMGIGTYPGNGQQYLSWIHLIDVIRIIHLCLENSTIKGPVNCVAPDPVTAIQFSQNVKNLTVAKLVLGIPSFLLRLIFGEGEVVLTNSHNVLPGKLNDLGYQFSFTTLSDALFEEFNESHVSISKLGEVDNISMSNESSRSIIKKGQYVLETRLDLDCDALNTFSFFSSPLNLGLTTPAWLNFRILDMPPQMALHSEISYTIRLAILDIKWVTKIIEWQPGIHFTDFQRKGPYKLWNHEHHIVALTDCTSYVFDRVTYRVPGGIIGRLLHKLIIGKTLKRIFNYRRKVIQMRFNSMGD